MVDSMMASQSNKTLSLTDLLQGEYGNLSIVTMENEGDAALLAQDWTKALKAYEQCETDNCCIDEKHGWCLGQSETWPEALAVLTPHRGSLSSAGLAMLAISSAGGWNTRYQMDETTRSLFDEILGEALADETPAYLAYAALFWFRNYHHTNEVLLAHARKGVSLYQSNPFLRLKMADYVWRLHESEGELYAVLVAGLDTHSTTEYLWTCAVSASRLEHWDEALAYLDRALSMTVADGERSRQAALQLRLASAEVLVSAGQEQKATPTYRELAALDASKDRFIVLAARRALVAMACRAEDLKEIRSALKFWLEAAIPSLQRCTTSDLLEGEFEPIYFFDGDM
ncbi:MAG: hypothetical protein ACREDP_10335, partial [Bradyrhizobium sp.]